MRSSSKPYPVTFLFLILLSPWAEAHAPSDIDAAFDERNGTLSVEVTHHTEDPADHFVEGLEVTVGDRGALVRSYQNQAFLDRQVDVLQIELDGESEIRLEATCSTGAVRGETIRVDGEEGTEEGRDLYSALEGNSILIEDERFAVEFVEEGQEAPRIRPAPDDDGRFGYDNEDYGFEPDDEFGTVLDPSLGYGDTKDTIHEPFVEEKDVRRFERNQPSSR